MAKYPIESGIQVSLNGLEWHKLTDHNRREIGISSQPIERASRMANGIMRKYVIDNKYTFSISWNYVPSKTDCTVDDGFSSEWLTAFYNANIFLPIKLKIVSAGEDSPETGYYPNESTRLSSLTANKVYDVYMTGFSSSIIKRGRDTDFVDMQIQFMEI